MKDVNEKNFGLVIAFLLPGFIVLWGVSFSSPTVAGWLARSSGSDAPTLGGFLYATLASLAVGMLLSALRWATLEQFLKLFGVRAPNIDFRRLAVQDRYTAFVAIVENHYRYYQYYSSSLLAVVASFIAYVAPANTKPTAGIALAVSGIVVILFLASRDALKKYYDRAAAVLGTKEGA